MRALFSPGGPLSVGTPSIYGKPVKKVTEVPLGSDGESVLIPQTVNVVSTTYLLPQEIDPVTKKRRYSIPLPALAEYLPGAQYTPKAFASVICRLREGDKSFTVLYFKSGKCLVVRQQCPEHARYVVHVIRLMLHKAPVLVRQTNGRIIHDTLGKYLTLKDWRIENIVVSGNLGMRVNIAQLAASAPGKIKYTPGNFPGAQFEMRIRDVSLCTCSKTVKCGCKVTIVCFDSGKLNIAGLRDAIDGNRIFYTIRSVICGYYKDDQSIVPKDQRYEARIERFAYYLAQNAEQRKEEHTKKRRVQRDQEEEEEDNDELFPGDEDVLIAHALDESGGGTGGGIEEEEEDRTTHLMRACEKRQVHNVKILLENDMEDPWEQDEHGLTALDRMKREEEARQNIEEDDDEEDRRAVEQIIALLEAHMKRRQNKK